MNSSPCGQPSTLSIYLVGIDNHWDLITVMMMMICCNFNLIFILLELDTNSPCNTLRGEILASSIQPVAGGGVREVPTHCTNRKISANAILIWSFCINIIIKQNQPTLCTFSNATAQKHALGLEQGLHLKLACTGHLCVCLLVNAILPTITSMRLAISQRSLIKWSLKSAF